MQAGVQVLWVGGSHSRRVVVLTHGKLWMTAEQWAGTFL